MPDTARDQHHVGAPRALLYLACAVALLATNPAWAGLPDTIARIKPSVVGVGTLQRTRSPSIVFSGTGMVLGDGLDVVTNAHVVPALLDTEHMEQLGIVLGGPDNTLRFRPATLVSLDREHDLAHLRLSGAPLPALVLADSDQVREGTALALTGYPLGMVLGLHAVTHRALLSAITPVVIPSPSTRQLDVHALMQLQKAPFDIFQLDGTAYPGNSGSPLYDPDTGAVVGIINMVLVKSLKETAISSPSGISYAIPANYIRQLLQKKEN